MATYSELENSSFTDLVVPFQTYNGIDQISTGTDTVTGYTLNITEFTFTPILSVLDTTAFGVSLDKMIWDFGDGTYGYGAKVKKRYEFPGDYKVTTIFTDQNGVTHRNSKYQLLKVYNYVPDALQWYTPNIAYPNGGLPEVCLCGRPSDDLTIFRYNSWQSWHMVSGDGGYFINLYSMGSQSMPLSRDRYDVSPDIHLSPTWRFVEDKQSTIPIERVQTDINTMIYVKFENGVLVHTTADDPEGEFAGSSGIATVNYIDDTPNRMISRRPPHRGNNFPARFENDNLSDPEFELINKPTEAKDVILYASFDTSKFPITRYDKEIFGFETLKQDYFQIYETQRVGLPILVKYNEPESLRITSNGIEGFNISTNKYLNSPISFCVQAVDKENFPICAPQIVPLSSNWHAQSQHFSAGDIATDVLTGQGFVSMYLSGHDTTFTRLVTSITSDEDFKFWDVGKFIANEPKNSLVKINMVARTSDQSPYMIGRDIYNKAYKMTNQSVTLLTGNLTDDIYGALATYVRSGKDYVLKTVARYWTTRNGESYYGVLSEDSTYGEPGVLDMTIREIDTGQETFGSYNALANIKSDTIKIPQDQYKFVAETIIDPPLYFNYETLYYYMSNPSNDIFHQIKPVHYRNYTYGEHGFTQTYTSPLTTLSPGNSGLYGFAVEPLGDVIMVDGDSDKIIRHWRNNDNRHEISIHELLPDDVKSKHYPHDPDEYGYSPSSVSLDSNLDYWVTLYDAVSTIKLDGRTNEIIASAVPPVRNYVADARQVEYETRELNVDQDVKFEAVEVPGKQGEYGENLIVPTAVETCKNDDIIVSYSNPLCSFLVRYDKDGNYLHKTDFPGEDRYFPGDICVDVSDHVWAVTEGTGLDSQGDVDLDVVRGKIYSYNEQLEYRLDIDSVSGAEYTDILSPVPSVPEEINYKIMLSTTWDYETSQAVTDGMLIADFGPNDINPPLTVYEDNTYVFKHMFFNKGEHAMTFKELIPEQLETFNDKTLVETLSTTGETITERVSGYNMEQDEREETVAIEITAESPDVIMLVEDNFPQNKLLLRVVKKPIYIPREADTFDVFDNPSYVVPDCNNNIWFSWGRRFCSRYNVLENRVDTTVAVGSAYDDPRYDNVDESTHERRDNAGRRSAIEGLGMDTGNNLLVINNADKRLYALYSESVPVSAYVNVPNSQIPYSDFSWMPSVSSDDLATEEMFLPSSESYLTDRQKQAFLANASQLALQNIQMDSTLIAETQENYRKYQQNMLGDVVFRTSHGAPGTHDVGLEQEIRAGGDWTGFKWVNKYDDRLVYSDNTSGARSLTGCSTEFNLIPKTGVYDIIKVNEDKDFASVIRQFVRMPNLTNKQIFYENFLDGVFGSDGSSPISLGKRIYERITNYTMNHADIDTCTMQALISLAEMTNYKLIEFGTDIPAEMQRVIDMLSVKYSKLRGTVTDYQNDFEKYGNWDQKSSGVNLGPEIMFIYDFDQQRSYGVSDIVRYNQEYYQATKSVPEGTKPTHRQDTEHWRYWPDGLIRSQHLSDMRRVFAPYLNTDKKYDGEEVTEEWVVDKYNKSPVLIRLVDRLLVRMDQRYVLREDSTGEFYDVKVRASNFMEQRHFNIDSIDDSFVISSPNSADHEAFDEDRRFNEILSELDVSNELITVDGDIITVMGALEHQNPTLVLYRGRNYMFKIDSPEDGIEIVADLSPNSPRLANFVTNQGTEDGVITISTSDDEIHGPIPSTIYYRSVNDPHKSGMIQIKDPTDIEHYSSLFNGVTAFNLDLTYNRRDQLQRLGWGVNVPDGQNAWQYYSLYEYVPNMNFDQDHVGNVIEWAPVTGPDSEPVPGGTTLGFNDIHKHSQWSQDGGVADIIVERTLREGLGMFDGFDELATHYDDMKTEDK